MRVDGLRADEVPEAGAVLARAFADDPLWTFLFGPRPLRVARVACTGLLRDHHRHGRVDAARDEAGRVVGVAAWLPPGAFPLGLRRELAGAPTWAKVGLLRPRSAPRAIRSVIALDALHPDEPHWFLSLLGVDPSWQGRGVGSRLLPPVLEQAGLVHLDTSKPANLPWYRRFGLEPVEQIVSVPGAPPSWALRRDAP
ncbi:MAG TPA: GNAT family N-acetyltransferase [Capillimicrobium sp.]|jgi:GNAT superfamily N-acetyltransferase